MRRSTTLLLVTALGMVVPSLAGAHNLLDHPAPAQSFDGPASSTVNSGGTGAEWELLTTFPTGNPHTDLDFFTQDGETYVSVGTLGAGPNGGGQTIVKLTEGGEPVDEDDNHNASFVAAHPSASCISDPSAALGLQHDVEAAPKGGALLNTLNPFADTSDTEILIDATDAEGRCHDGGTYGIDLGAIIGSDTVPQGGLEFIDVTDIENPVEIGLTSHIGESHTVNVDPKRPHIAYSVTSDSVSVTVDEDDPRNSTRNNEDPESSAAMNLDGFEVVDFSSCMDFPDGTSVEDKRDACRPEVYRYRWPDVTTVLGHTNHGSVYACHELEVYPDDTLTCASGSGLLMLDMSGAFDDNGTPDDYTDDTPRGDPLPCAERATTSNPPFTTGATIIDCVVGGTEEDPVPLTVPGWLDIGAPSLEGVQVLGTAHHMGRESATGAFDPAYPSDQDIDFNHEAELTHSGRFVFASDERGGGVLPPGASCAPGADNTAGNGGLHAYAVDRLDTAFPAQFDEDGNYDAAATAEAAWDAYATTPAGDKAIIRVPIRTGPQATLCTAHVFQQIPDQQRIFMGWYSQGTHVIDYIEHEDGTFEFQEVAWFIPENANQWVSHVFDYERNEDGTYTYYGVAGDFALGEAGRSAIDIWRVTMPPPTQPLVSAAVGDATGPTAACDEAFVPAGGFDDAATSVHTHAIDCISWYGLTQGMTATDFAPGESVTRGQLASFVAALLVEGGVTLPADAPDAFDDDDDSVHHDNINALAALGIITGRQDVDDADGDGDTDELLYFPDEPVTRAQMATFVTNAHEAATGTLPESPPNSFDDDDESVHHASINALAALGVVTGRQDVDDADGDTDTNERLYFPDEDIARGQMASFLARDLRLLVDDGVAFPGGATPDLDSQSAAAGEDVTGTVATHKSVDAVTADGCGLEGEDATLDGTQFTITIPSGQSTGACELAITVTTSRGATQQQVTHTFDFQVVT